MSTIDSLVKEEPVLSSDKVHVFLYQISLFNSAEMILHLSEDEQARADKLKIQQKRDQFVITRALLRLLLSSILGKEPQDIVFSYEQHGKPTIEDKINDKAIEFNISHSGDYALIGITLENKVGVDIEEINPDINHQSLSKRFFSEKEKNELQSLVNNKQRDTFYRIWARKESFIKAIGKGVAFGLDRFSVSLDMGNDVGMEILTSIPLRDDWFVYNLLEMDNYKTALTTSRKDINIIFHQ
jgi:4'-phosphopantetheinyl transferase